MTILPILLSAVAVLLAAAAFFKALAASGAAQGNSLVRDAVAGLSDQVGGIQDSLRQIAQDLSETRGSLGGTSEAMRAQSSLIETQTAVIRSLPGDIAEATGSAAALAEARALRETLQAASTELASVRSGQDAAGRASSAGFASLSEAVSTLGREMTALRGDERVPSLLREGVELARSHASGLEAISATAAAVVGSLREAVGTLAEIRSGEAGSAERLEGAIDRLSALASGLDSIRGVLETLPVRVAEEIATRPAPMPELEELAVAVRDAGGMRGDAVRSMADAVSRVSDRLDASADEGRVAREDAANRLSQSLSALEAVVGGVREALLPLGDALRGHGEAVIPVVKSLETAQDRLEEAAVSLRANQVEFAASVGVFSSAAQDLSTGLGAFAREGAADAAHDPAAVQQALLESIERLLVGFTESLRSALAEADVRHREALVEIASRLPEQAG